MFTISAPVCLSTGVKPNYPKPDHAVALFDFDAVTSTTWEVAGDDVKVVYADADCTMTIDRRIHSNSRGIFSLTLEKKFTFSPEACELSVTFATGSQPVSKALAVGFQDSADTREDLPFRVDQASDSYRLTSLGQAPFRDLWSNYGCSIPDAISYSLMR